MSDNRFEIIHGEANLLPKDITGNRASHIRSFIYRDKGTGVLYLYTEGREGRSTMTPLLDPDGKPIVDKSES